MHISPDFDNEKNEVQRAIRCELIEGEIWQVIAMDWFTKWNLFVDHHDLLPVSENLSPIDNSFLASKTRENLRLGLIPGKDFILLPNAIAVSLFSKYGGGPQYSRVVCNIGSIEKPLLRVDLYPVRFSVYHCNDDHPKPVAIRRQYHTIGKYSRFALLRMVVKEFKQLLDINPLWPTRIWIHNSKKSKVKKRNTHVTQNGGVYYRTVTSEHLQRVGSWVILSDITDATDIIFDGCKIVADVALSPDQEVKLIIESFPNNLGALGSLKPLEQSLSQRKPEIVDKSENTGTICSQYRHKKEIESSLVFQCSVCISVFPGDCGSGGFCPTNHHPICWSCLLDYIKAAKQPGAISTYTDSDGNLTCPSCKDIYDIACLTKSHAPPVLIDEIIDLKVTMKISEARQIILKEEKMKFEQELQKLQEMDEFERNVTILRRNIVENILTLRCPRCLTAFIDFDGCYALTCVTARCNAALCAWCLTDCGTDAHPHVLSCSLNPQQGNYQGDPQKLREVHNRVRIDKITQLLQNQSNEVKSRLKEIMKKDFEDLQISTTFF